MKRIISLITTVLLLMTSLISVQADNDNSGPTVNETVNVNAEEGKESITGDGTITTIDDTRTAEQIQDDATREDITDFIDTINGMMGDGGIDFSFPEDGFTLEWPELNGELTPFDPVDLPSYDLSPEDLIPNEDEMGFDVDITVPDGDIDDENEEAPSSVVPLVKNTGGYTAVRQKNIPIDWLSMYANQLTRYNDQNAAPFKWPTSAANPWTTNEGNYVSGDEARDIQADMDKAFRDRLKNNGDSLVYDPDKALADIKNYPQLDNLANALDGKVHYEQLPGSDLNVLVPNSTGDLYDILAWYLQQADAQGESNIRITRYTIYSERNFAFRTLKKAYPLSEYRWTVTKYNEGGRPGTTYEQVTKLPTNKILFSVSGCFRIEVYNTQTVVRKNQVSGQRSEVWVLSNGDIFNGLVIYCNTTSFRSIVTDNIGPSIEEVRLRNSCFTTVVTPEMVNRVQYASNGRIFTANTDGYTTERVR